MGVAFVEGGEEGKKWLRSYLASKGAEWPQIVAGDSRWYRGSFEEFNVSYIPLYLLVGPDGKLIEANLSPGGLGPRLERALAGG